MKYTDEYLAKAGQLTTMGDLNNRIAALEEETPTTPINLSELEARVTYLEETAQKWALVSLNAISQSGGTRVFEIPEEYRGWNWIVHQCFYKNAQSEKIQLTITGTGLNVYKYLDNFTGDVIKFTQNGDSQIIGNAPYGIHNQDLSLSVMFYK